MSEELEIQAEEAPKIEKINLNEIKDAKSEIDFEETLEKLKKDPITLKKMKEFVEFVYKKMAEEDELKNKKEEV